MYSQTEPTAPNKIQMSQSMNLAIAQFDPSKKALVRQYDTLSNDQIEYILSQLRFTSHPIKRIADKIADNYRELLRRDLREVRLNPDGMDQFIAQLQLRIDTSEVKDGIGVGNATASAITATGTQEAFNVKRVTGKKVAIGNNKALDVVKGKRDPTDEGAVISYYQPPTFTEAYHRVDQLTQRYLRDFIEPRVEIDTARELNIPEWYHRLASLNWNEEAAISFEDRFGVGVSEVSERFNQSQKYIFMRLSLDIDAMYRCQVTPVELAEAIQSIKQPKGLDVKIMAIPAPFIEATIDVAILEVIKYQPFSEINPTKEVAGERVEHLRHRHILALIRDAIFGKHSPLLRGIKGVTEVEVGRDNVDNAIADIYEVFDSPSIFYSGIMPDNWDRVLPPEVSIVINDNDELKVVRQYTKDPNNPNQDIENSKFDPIADDLIGRPFTFQGKWQDESVQQFRTWVVDIKSFQRIYQSISVIPVLRYLTFYDPITQRCEYEMYVRCYDTLKGRRTPVSSTSILNDPSRYRLSGDRFTPNSHVTSLRVQCPYDLNQVRFDCLQRSNRISSPDQHNPLFHITHRTYGRVFYKLLEHPNVDIDMCTYSNGIIVAPMLGIEAYYTISVYGLRSALGEGINPQHASMFASHRSVTGHPATLTLTARATAGVGPITASQMNPPIATFSRMANRPTGESTTSTVGFMCSTSRESPDFETQLDAYGRPIIDHFNAKTASIADLGYEPVVDVAAQKKATTSALAEYLNSLTRDRAEANTPKIVINQVKPLNLSAIRVTVVALPRLPITSHFVAPSLRQAVF